ncbi:MAG: HD domain-containing protein [Terracidiphilus sp.]
MTTSGWRESVRAYIRAEAQPQDKFGHQPRLYALARRLAQQIEFDDDILFAAAWMHDLGVFLGHRPRDPELLKLWNHVPYTIAMTRELLAGWGFPEGKLDGVAEAISTHQPEGQPTTFEAVLLRDADILEQLGAIGVLRAMVKVGRDTRYDTFSSVIPVLQRALENLPAQLRLNLSKDLAASRIEFLRFFLSSLEDEAAGLLY